MRRFLHPGFRSSSSKLKGKLLTWSGDLESLVTSDAVEFGPPFDDNDADLVIRSSDCVDFPVHQAFLSKASPHFKTMLSLPQPSTSGPSSAKCHSHPRGSLPTVPVVEKSSVVHILLSFLLPITPVLPRSLDEAMDFVNAAHKYEMEVVEVRARSILRRFLTVDTSLCIYAFAHRLELRDEMVEAARLTLRLPLLSDYPEHDTHSPYGHALLDLWSYRKAYLKALAGKLESCIVADSRWPSLLPPGELGEWIDAHRCQSDQQCHNNAETWRSILATGAAQMVAEMADDLGHMPTWKFCCKSMLMPSSCQCSCEACSVLRQSPQKVERSLVDVVSRTVTENIILKVKVPTRYTLYLTHLVLMTLSYRLT